MRHRFQPAYVHANAGSLWMLAALLSSACNSSLTDSALGGYYEEDRQAGRDAGSGGNGAGDFDDASAPPAEPEVELKLTPPASNRRYVYIASRSTDTLARVDSVTLAVAPIRVGDEPTEVRTVAEGNLAVVLNIGDETLSIVRSTPASDDVTSVDVLPGCNALDLAPDGRWAVAWYNNRTADAGDEIGSLQELTIVDTDLAEAYAVSVGFTIRSVEFDDESARLFVVTDSGVNVVDLAELDGDIAIPTIDLGDDPLVGSTDREVQIAQASGVAIVRSTSAAEVRLVSLIDGTIERIALDAIPSDLDLLADGRTVALALRDAGVIAVFDVADAVSGAATVRSVAVEGAVPGVVLPLEGTQALTFRTSSADGRVAMLDLATGEMARTFILRKGILAASATPRVDRALVVHRAGSGAVSAGAPIEEVIAASNAVSLLDLATGYSKLTLLPDEPDDFVFAPDGSAVFLMLANPARGVRQVERIDLNTFATTTIVLDSEPEAIGVVPDSNRVWVSQVSNLGRITFIDIDTGSMHEISGYQLNAFIE